MNFGPTPTLTPASSFGDLKAAKRKRGSEDGAVEENGNGMRVDGADDSMIMGGGSAGLGMGMGVGAGLGGESDDPAMRERALKQSRIRSPPPPDLAAFPPAPYASTLTSFPPTPGTGFASATGTPAAQGTVTWTSGAAVPAGANGSGFASLGGIGGNVFGNGNGQAGTPSARTEWATTPSEALPSPWVQNGSANGHGVNGNGFGVGVPTTPGGGFGLSNGAHGSTDIDGDSPMVDPSGGPTSAHSIPGGSIAMQRSLSTGLAPQVPLSAPPDYFSQQRAPSPIAAQPFTTTLQPPPARVGLMQPVATPPISAVSGGGGEQGMDVDASAVEAVQMARSAHGPHCSTIPRLVLSEHPDPVTGKRSMWSHCQSCGSVDMVG